MLSPGLAEAATIHVENNGRDSYGSADNVLPCGSARAPAPKKGPCRSIRQAMANAVDGDTILVGPGRYALDLDGNGILGEPGEESGSYPCGSMIEITKKLTLVSRAGAAATVLDGARLVHEVVKISAADVVFGKPEQGFMVTGATEGLIPTNPCTSLEGAVYTAASNVTIAGNIVFGNDGFGVYLSGNGHLLKDNLAFANYLGGFRVASSATTVKRNVASVNGYDGFSVGATSGLSMEGNVASANTRFGFYSQGADFTGATAVGNVGFGFVVDGGGMATTITASNIYGNNDTPDAGTGTGLTNCGLYNHSGGTVDATGSFWGTATGPGPNPADRACNEPGNVTLTAPHSTHAFPLP
jgi:parallel beta-helix repeat protein